MSPKPSVTVNNLMTKESERTRAHFAVIAYHATFGVWPSASQGATIVAEVQDAAAWQRNCKLFFDNGWKPLIGNLLDRYRKDTANGTHQPGRSTHRQSERPARGRDALAYLDSLPDDE